MNPTPKPTARLKKAAKEFEEMLGRLGGGTVEVNGVVIAEVEDATLPNPIHEQN